MIFATWKIRGWLPWRLSVMNILSASLLWDDSGWNSMIARRARMPEQKFDEEEAFPYTIVGTDDAKRMIEAGAHVIDVRQPDEWNRGHISEAELVPITGIYSFVKALKDLHLPEDPVFIFVLASGQPPATPPTIPFSQSLYKL